MDKKRAETKDSLPSPTATNRFHKVEKIRRNRRRTQLHVQNNLGRIRTKKRQKNHYRDHTLIAKSLWRKRSTKKLRSNTTTGLEVTARKRWQASR
jgi:hypothetical protein